SSATSSSDNRGTQKIRRRCDMLSRREVVGKLAVGTAAVCVAGAARASVPTTHDAVTPSTDPAQPEQLAASAPQAATGERGFRRTVAEAGRPETRSAAAP